MEFAARLTRCPIPFDPQAGQEARAPFADLTPEIGDLIAGTAGCSPFLRGLLAREADWIRAALLAAPEAALDDELRALGAVPLDALAEALRQAKRRIALLVALADLGGVWALQEVTGALTRLADRAVDLSLKRLVADEIRRGKIPGARAQDAETAAGMVALAMGKMGAAELNYSSDIDLICLYDETRFDDAVAAQEARAAFIRVTRKMTALLSDLTPGGYVFRTDLRLRPDASVTPVCLSMAAAESYYESVGRTWERAAYIKARPCGGDLAAGARFLTSLTPFVWRKHLDFAAIQDAHDMRLRIRAHKGLAGPIALEGHDMKLGRGGIREIEFFTQTRQLIAGGRDPSLRVRGSVEGLARLVAAGWVPAEDGQDLAAQYRAHREIEHRVQMVQDAQTHLLPTNPEGFDRLACMCGQADTARFRAALRERLERVDTLTEGFFAPDDGPEAPPLDPEDAKIAEGWANYPALRSSRAVQIFDRLRPVILQRLTQAANTAEALRAFDGFLAGLPAGVQLFSLFEANPSLIDLIVDICATAPQLAMYLSRNAGVLDAVLGGGFFAPWPGGAALRAELSERLATAADYEGQLDAARRWAKEWHFRVGVHHLRGLIDAVEAGKQYAELAEAVLAALWPACVANFAAKHGAPPGRGAAVLGMGSLGAGRLNAASDLDLIVIYDAQGAEASDGRRPLAVRPYYARLTQALVTALTAPMAEGRLYEVDMRLRPSGRQGPVATSWAAFRDYQQTEAWTWEHLALTRARPIAGDAGLGADIEAFRRELLAAKGQGGAVRRDVTDMRARLRAAKPGRGAWEARLGPGRMMEVELAAQMGALIAGSPARRVEMQIAAARRAGLIDAAAEGALLAAYRLCWRITAAHRLLTARPLDPGTIGDGARAFLLRETGAASISDLAAALAERTAAADRAISGLLPGAEDDG
ncbi:glutamate-ammonia ligase adenylyltransferase [Defluviimonas sp. 20V17]|uniref:Glutamate-ammonia-ligase adenylyltransferase n=1 Tax=Allgaiera indica TaxID=765699 RepID=A0AAN4ZYT9_9RHOB|nr:[glutamate--ammonia-ligase] adenylyltransferase [Allgaiera indica]KDB03349.1 glutamate-ammonia ligase adenylyltransferase [Defluviimonas sp. 20V17]GHE00476.1 glutamate-ammonia-ligase adenylyltransferase [Allgaiera indica]SDW61365.1 glutamate-ammonia-ligase adenylyltransferase [Allgaiera indica]